LDKVLYMDVDYGCSHNLLQMMLVDTLRMGKTTRSALYLLWVVGMATRLAAGVFNVFISLLGYERFINC